MGVSQSTSSAESVAAASSFIDETISSHPLTVFSKTTCPYCDRVKRVLGNLGAKPFAVELNQRADGQVIQDELARRTGSRTVPKVFVGKECIGGCDATIAMQQQGTLVEKLKEAGALSS